MDFYVKLNQNRFIKYYSTELYEDYQKVTINNHYTSFIPKYYNLMWVDNNNIVKIDKLPSTDYENKLNDTEDSIKSRKTKVQNNVSDLNDKIDNNISNNLDTAKNYDKNKAKELNDKIDTQIKTNNSILTPIKSYNSYDEAMDAANNSDNSVLCMYPSTTQPGKSVIMNQIFSYGNHLTLPNIYNIKINNPNNNKFDFDNVYANYDQENKKIMLHGKINYKATIDVGAIIAMLKIKDLRINNITGNWLQSQTISVDTNLKRNEILITNNNKQSTTINLEGTFINVEYDSTLKSKLPKGMPERFDVFEGIGSIYNLKESPAMYYIPDGVDIGIYNPYGTGRGFIAQKVPYGNGYIQTVPLSNNSTSYMYYLYPTSYGSYTNCFYGSLTPYTTQDFVDYATKIRNLSQTTLIGSNTPRQTW